MIGLRAYSEGHNGRGRHHQHSLRPPCRRASRCPVVSKQNTRKESGEEARSRRNQTVRSLGSDSVSQKQMDGLASAHPYRVAESAMLIIEDGAG